MAVCNVTTRRAVLTAFGTVAICASPVAAHSIDPFVPLAREFLSLFDNPDDDESGDCSQGWNDRISALESEMTETPPRTMAGLLLGLKVIHANDMLAWTDLEANIVAAGIDIIEREERA